ncbi:hypothetical protein QUF90_17055 [Desulfococcaceae bacterium HSG9]|nr:hypothetical protein [Desulfococcaceae bacterium HSG9]
MAIWEPWQRERLVFEENIIKKELPDFWFRDHAKGGLTTIWGYYTTSANQEYRLCVWIKSGFPYKIPGLYITFPKPLYGYNGRTIQSYGTSHRMHVWEPDWNNSVKICHWQSEHWSASYTLLSIIMKGFLWLEAYEVHCKTGKHIDAYSLTFE